MPTRHSRTGALLLGLALALTASPAVASTEQIVDSNMATPSGQAMQPSQQQAAPKLLRIVNTSQFGSEPQIRPGDETSFGFTVQNDGQQREEFVLTITLPPELTLVGTLRSGDAAPVTCEGNVCRGFVEAGGSIENQTARTVVGTVRLSSSFRGDSTTIRADLQEDANPNPSERTRTLTVPVAQAAAQQPAAQQPAAGAQSSGTGTGTGITTLPRTGDRTTITALLALCLLLLGAMAQLVGTRRPGLHSR